MSLRISVVGCPGYLSYPPFIATDAFSPDLKAISIMESPEFKEYVTLMRQWYEKGYIPKEADPDYNASMKAGKYTLHFHIMKTDIPGESKMAFGMEFTGQPLVPGYGIKTTAAVAAVANGICATSKHPDKAIQIMELIHTDKVIANLLAYGVEGKHW